jgi:hypothetical protein
MVQCGVRIHNWEVTGADVSGSAQTTLVPERNLP